MCRVAPSPLPSEALSARAVLPNTDDVAARVADPRDPQIAFWVRLFHEICARSRGLFKRFVEFFDEDVRPHPTLAGHGVIGPEVADDVACAVLEGRVLAVSANRPPEDGFVERGRGLRVGGRDPQVRNPAGPEDRVAPHEAIVPGKHVTGSAPRRDPLNRGPGVFSGLTGPLSGERGSGRRLAQHE